MRSLKTLITIFLFIHWTIGAATSFKTEQWNTQNGTKVVFYQAMEVPMLDISLAFAAGSAYDQNNYGLSALTAQMLNEGSSDMSAVAIAEELDNTGAQFEASITKDMAVFNLRTLSSPVALNKASDLFTQITNHPNFPQEAMIREKNQFLMAIAQTKSAPDNLATEAFFQNLYQNHPYAHSSNGTEQSVQSIKRQDLIQFYKNYYVANNATLIFVGAIDSQTAHQLAEKITRDLATGTAAAPIPQAKALKSAQHNHLSFPSSQTVVRLGQLGIDHKNPNYFPLIVGNYILGGAGLTSKLAIEVREKRGLTYSINSQFIPMPGPGPFIISLSTENKQAKKAIGFTEEILKNYVLNGPNQEELNAAKSYLNGSFPLSLASNKAIANILLRMTFYHLPSNYLDTYIDNINRVTREDIKRAFQQELHPDKLLQLTVGPT